jgi:hypothetical protein
MTFAKLATMKKMAFRFAFWIHQENNEIDCQASYAPHELSDEHDVDFHPICAIDPTPTVSDKEKLLHLLSNKQLIPNDMYIYHHADILNRADEPNLFELLFPHLFPYSTGGSNTVSGSEAFHHWCNTFVNAYSPDRRYQ